MQKHMETVQELMDKVVNSKNHKASAIDSLFDRVNELAGKMGEIKQRIVDTINEGKSTDSLMDELHQTEKEFQNRSRELDLIKDFDRETHGVSKDEIYTAFAETTKSFQGEFDSAAAKAIEAKEAYETAIAELIEVGDEYNRAKGQVAVFLRHHLNETNPENKGSLAFKLTPPLEIFMNSKHRSDLGQ